MDAESLRRRSVVRPFRVLLREREVLASVGPPLADQLRGRSLMSPSEYPRELRRIGEDSVGGHHEAREIRRHVGARPRARVEVGVQEPFRGHDSILPSRIDGWVEIASSNHSVLNVALMWM